MKLKLRFDKESLQAFFLANVEKIVFGVIVIGCGVIIFAGGKAFKDPLPTPKALQDLTSQAESNVENTVPAKCQLYQERQLKDYTAVAGRSEDRVEEKLYTQPSIWASPLFDPKIKRGKPEVFSVQNLRAVFGRGPFTRQGGGAGGGGGDVRGYRWIVVAGAVPFKKQLDEYVRVFEPAVQYDPRADIPKYAGYVIERAEVGSRSAGQELEWKEIDVDVAKKKVAYIGNPQPETLEAKYLDPPVTFPLPPLAGKVWGPETQHEDLVGPSFDKVQQDPAAYKDRKVAWIGDFRPIVQTPEQKEERPVSAFIAKLADPGKKPEERIFAVLFASKEAMEQSGKGGTIKGKVAGRELIKLPGAGATEGKNVYVPLLIHEAPAPKADDRDGPEMEIEGPTPGRPLRAGRPGPRPAAGAERDESVDYKLFRFFDLNVEPGKHYQYRVHLVLENPNHLEQAKAKPRAGEERERRREPLLPRYLKDPADGISPTLETAATAPTEPVTVPEDLRLLALSVAPVKAFHKSNIVDPSGTTGKMAVVQWMPATGREARHEFEAQRGTLANFAGQKSSPKAGEREQPTKTDFVTDAIVVDMHVAQLDKDTNGTGEIVVLDGQGQLRVLSQLEGEMEYMLLLTRPTEGTAGGRTDTDEPPDRQPGDLPTPIRRPRPLLQEGPPTRGLDFDRKP